MCLTHGWIRSSTFSRPSEVNFGAYLKGLCIRLFLSWSWRSRDNWWALMFCGGRGELTVYLLLQDGLPMATCLTCSWSLCTWQLDAVLYPSIHASSHHAALQHHLDFMIPSHQNTWLYMSLANYIDSHIQPMGLLDLWIMTWQWCTWHTWKDQCEAEEDYTIHTTYYVTNKMLANTQRILYSTEVCLFACSPNWCSNFTEFS